MDNPASNQSYDVKMLQDSASKIQKKRGHKTSVQTFGWYYHDTYVSKIWYLDDKRIFKEGHGLNIFTSAEKESFKSNQFGNGKEMW